MTIRAVWRELQSGNMPILALKGAFIRQTDRDCLIVYFINGGFRRCFFILIGIADLVFVYTITSCGASLTTKHLLRSAALTTQKSALKC